MNKLKQVAQEALDFVELISEIGAQDMRGWLTLNADPKGVDRLQEELRAAIKDEPDWPELLTEVYAAEEEISDGKTLSAKRLSIAKRALRKAWEETQ